MGKRAGAVTVGLDLWHYDIQNFLELQVEDGGDSRHKAFDIFPQVCIPDEFMRRKDTKDATWTMVCPTEVKNVLGIDLVNAWGAQFERYYSIVEAHVDKLQLVKTVKARELWKTIMKRQFETGRPYLFFKDTANKHSPNQNDGTILQANLCVTGDTPILTDRGYLPIQDLAGEKVTLWNGQKWSEDVPVFKTSDESELLRISFSNGIDLECTPYHHFWIQENYKGKVKKIEAQELKQGMKLIKYDLPVIDFEDSIDFPCAYTSGFYSGDGYNDGVTGVIALYGKKKELLGYIEARNKTWSCGSHSKDLQEKAIYLDTKQDRIVVKLPQEVPPKFTVPEVHHTLKSKLEWLAGLLDSDGTVAKNGTNESFQICNTEKEFLIEVMLMLQTLGVNSKVTLSYPSRQTLMPDGKGGEKYYSCSELYRLLIPSDSVFRLSELGLQTHRLKRTKRKPQRSAAQYVTVVSVSKVLEKKATYCFTEPLRNMGMFKGILAGNCVESFSPIKPNELTHCCNLLSVNMAQLTESYMIKPLAELAVNILEWAVDLTTPPTAEAQAHNNRYRTIGIGFTGLADWLAYRNVNYHTGTDIAKEFFDDFMYYAVRESCQIAKIKGSFDSFSNSEWAKGNILGRPLDWFIDNSVDPKRWVDLSLEIKENGIRHSQLGAIAPNTSTSLVQGCTASVLPPYNLLFYDKNSKGRFPVIPPYYPEKKWYYTDNTKQDQKQLVLFLAQAVVPYIDSGISMELNFNYNNGIKPKYVSETLNLAWELECKTVYYTRSITKKDLGGDCVSCAN